MFDHAQGRPRRWILRRLERRARRLAVASPPAPRFVAAASVADGYCEALGPVCNDDDPAGMPRGCGPNLALVRS